MKKLLSATLLLVVTCPFCYGHDEGAVRRILALDGSSGALERSLKQMGQEALEKNLTKAVGENHVSQTLLLVAYSKGMMSSYRSSVDIQKVLEPEYVWPDEIQANYILEVYLQSGAEKWNKASPFSDKYVATSLMPSPQKYIWLRLNQEASIYQSSIKEAETVYPRLYSKSLGGSRMTDEFIEEANAFIRTPFVSLDLRIYLQTDLAKKDPMAFLNDVRDYYGLDNVSDADAAMGFLQRHPYGCTLPLTRELNNPFVSEKIKNNVRQFMRRKRWSDNALDNFHNALETLFAVRKNLYTKVSESEQIQNQAQMLRNFTARLRSWLYRNPGQWPEWHATDKETRELATDWMRIYRSQSSDDVGTLHWAYQGLYDLLVETGQTAKWPVKKGIASPWKYN